VSMIERLIDNPMPSPCGLVTISLKTACDTQITVAKSSCSTNAPIVLVRPGSGLSSLRCGCSWSNCRTPPSAPQRR
jgi:hypothetical protein